MKKLVVDVQRLRARSCAVMTGIETVIADDPNLTVRLNKDQLGLDHNIAQPKSVILDTHLRIATDAKILKSPEEVIIYTCAEKNEKYAQLENNGIEIVKVKSSNNCYRFESCL